MVGGIVFDMDGVLVLTAELHRQVWEEYVASSPHESLRAFRRRPGRRALDVLTHVLGAEVTRCEAEAIVQRLQRRFLDLHASGDALVAPGVHETLAELHRHVPVGIATSSSPGIAQTLLGDVLQHADVLVSSVDYDEGKPHPQPYLTAATRLGIDPGASLAVEDTGVGVESAKAAGFRVVGVTGTLSAGALIGAGAVMVGRSVAELGKPIRTLLGVGSPR